MSMPGLNGFETPSALRTESGPNLGVSVVAFTAGNVACRLLAAGLDSIADKPVSLDDLIAALSEALYDSQILPHAHSA